MPKLGGKTITIVVPVYNEHAGLDALVERLVSVVENADFSWNVLFVDDGSTDETLPKLRQINAKDRRFSAISFSRNFGKEVAIAAGLRHARGDAVIIMDGDLQHPPEIVPIFVARWREGYKVVFGARQKSSRERLLRHQYSRLFHAVFRRISFTPLPIGAVDFLLLDRKAVDAINRIGERTRFSKGLYAWIGFASTVVPFVASERHAGSSRWSFLKLARFALDGLISFSSLPLKVWSYVGASISLIALAYSVYFLIYTVIYATDLPGFPSLIVSIMFFAGVQLISLGVLGEYIARIYEEVKARPLYLVAEEIGLDAETLAASESSRLQARPT
jgi:glycosyltransferase involved in cell wall biosynthesis